MSSLVIGGSSLAFFEGKACHPLYSLSSQLMEWKLADKTFTIPPVGGYDSVEGGEMFLPLPNPLPGGNTHMISGANPQMSGSHPGLQNNSCRCFLLAPSLFFILKTLVFIERHVGEWFHPGLQNSSLDSFADPQRRHALLPSYSYRNGVQVCDTSSTRTELPRPDFRVFSYLRTHFLLPPQFWSPGFTSAITQWRERRWSST